jgi:glycine cleavage system aminomethyltransferase T
VLGVMGPRSRSLLGALTDTALGDEAFPFATSQVLRLAGTRLRATRMTYVGELGWELTIPVGEAPAVYDALHGAGTPTDAGYYAIDALRLEKGYRAFPPELNPDLSPVEAGLLFATALSSRTASDKNFLGRVALEARRDRLRQPGPRRRLCSFVLDAPEPMVWGGELVLRDGEPAGQVTSAAYGATVRASVGLALLRTDRPVRQEDLDSSSFEIDLAGEPVAVRVTLRAPLE